MALIGTVSVPEYAMDTIDSGMFKPVETDPPAPTDGSVLLAYIVNGGTITFNQGERRLIAFAGGTDPYPGIVPISGGSSSNAQAPVGWAWAGGITSL